MRGKCHSLLLIKEPLNKPTTEIQLLIHQGETFSGEQLTIKLRRDRYLRRPTYLEGQALPLDDAELAEVVAVVGGVDDVGVVQLPHLSQLAVKLHKGQGKSGS